MQRFAGKCGSMEATQTGRGCDDHLPDPAGVAPGPLTLQVSA